jgi:hypothetical protein
MPAVKRDNPGGFKWLKNEVGMPTAIEKVVEALAELPTVNAGPNQIVSSNKLRAAYRQRPMASRN